MPLPRMPMKSNIDLAQNYQNMAIGARSNMRPGQTTKTDPADPTLGGAISAGVGGAAAGASIGSAMATGATSGSSAGPWGAAIGAVAGMLAYAFS